MSDDKPNPIDDVRKGLGLLFRAAKTAVEKLPTKDVEQAVVSTAREVGRAVENVATTLERQVLGKKAEPDKKPEGEGEKPEDPKPDPPDEPGTAA